MRFKPVCTRLPAGCDSPVDLHVNGGNSLPDDTVQYYTVFVFRFPTTISSVLGIVMDPWIRGCTVRTRGDV